MRRFLLFSVTVAGVCHASVTEFWVTSSQEDFLRGEVHNVQVNSTGEISLAPELSVIDGVDEKFVWSITGDGRGNVYAGTGDEGILYKIDRSGNVEVFCDLEEPEVLSLCFQNPYLYAGVAPTGRVYRIDRKGRAEVFFESRQKYVWDICADEEPGFYIATGEKGMIFRVSETGSSELVYESTDRHVTRIREGNGTLYATTSGSGKVYQLSDGDLTVLAQIPEEEIMALEVDDEGALWIGANADNRETCGVYRLDREGSVLVHWSCADSVIHSLTFWAGGLLVGTGNRGRVYEIDESGDVILVAECRDEAVLCLEGLDELWMGTGNHGAVWRLSADVAEEGVFVSEVFDAGEISSWGQLSVEAETVPESEVELWVRSGNCSEVDDTWSNWGGPYGGEERIDAPRARFIQWKAVLNTWSGDSPVVREVSVPHVQKNLPPRIERIVLEDDVENREKRVSWEAFDPNGDSLLYAVCFKGKGERNWKTLAEELSSPQYDLALSLFPDGVYLLKVIADDSPHNPLSLSLSTEEISRPFRIDNTPPTVSIRSVKREGTHLVCQALIVDDVSLIRSCEYSIDAGDYDYLAPDDGLFDSQEEHFSFRIEEKTKGEHLLVIRGEDSQGNYSLARRIVAPRR